MRSGGTVKRCRHLNSKMKDRWAYSNVLPETMNAGSYKASQLWGGGHRLTGRKRECKIASWTERGEWRDKEGEWGKI